MCLLLESIKCKNGVLHNIETHEARMRESVFKLYGVKKRYSLHSILAEENCPQQGLYKCRIVYGKKIESLKFKLYKRIKVKDIAFVHDEKIIYNHKYLDRLCLEKYTQSFDRNTEVIFVKKNLLRDASYSNIALYNGEEWHTPTYPLLKGTMRSKLLEEGKIHSKKIHFEEINQYESISFINALNDLGDRLYKLS